MLSIQNNSIRIEHTQDLAYSVYFLRNLFKRNSDVNNLLLKLCTGKKLMVVVDERVHEIFGNKIMSFLDRTQKDHIVYRLNALEKNKTMSTVLDLCNTAKKNNMQRNSIFIGIGGGVTLDIVGFAAFIFRRRIPYIKIPTTLVGIIDAGIGVKVGINFKKSKNFLGGYYPPLAVFNDQSFLRTLSRQEIRCGLYEVIKIALIADSSLFNLLEQGYLHFMDKNFDKGTDKVVFRAASLLLEEIASDPIESNLRRIIDLGHTFSPFLEMQSNNRIPHGEAVGIDILISSYISLSRNLLLQEDFDRIFSLVKSIGFSDNYLLPKAKQLFSALEDIRCHRAGKLNLVLPTGIGSGIFTDSCSCDDLETVLDVLKKETTVCKSE